MGNGVAIESVEDSLEYICMVCGVPGLTDEAVKCPKCGRSHHGDCWDFNGGCSTYGCDLDDKVVSRESVDLIVVDKPEISRFRSVWNSVRALFKSWTMDSSYGFIKECLDRDLDRNSLRDPYEIIDTLDRLDLSPDFGPFVLKYGELLIRDLHRSGFSVNSIKEIADYNYHINDKVVGWVSASHFIKNGVSLGKVNSYEKIGLRSAELIVSADHHGFSPEEVFSARKVLGCDDYCWLGQGISLASELNISLVEYAEFHNVLKIIDSQDFDLDLKLGIKSCQKKGVSAKQLYDKAKDNPDKFYGNVHYFAKPKVSAFEKIIVSMDV